MRTRSWTLHGARRRRGHGADLGMWEEQPDRRGRARGQGARGADREVGAEPESVECDGDLPAEVGATLRCVLTAPNGEQVGLTVTATEVADDDVSFDILVDDELMS